MPALAIRAQQLGKRYRLEGRRVPYRMLRDVVAGIARRVAAPAAESFWALRDVSFDIGEGEVVGVIGRNGAGKSTLLKLLSRVTRPTEGQAEIYGRVGSLLEVGTGFQPELSGRENIFLNGAILGMRRSEIARRLDEIVAFAEVERFLDAPVKHYSSGMYLRLAFAVAAHLEPDILVVDEVLAVGDVAFQRKCLGRMRDVATSGRTVLFVSHSMPAIRQLCTRGLLIDCGRLVLDSSVGDVVTRYLTADGRVSGDGEIAIDAPRVVGTGEARLRRVRLRDREGESVQGVFLGQPFTIEMTYEVSASIGDAAVEVGISTADGLRVVTSASIDGGRAPFRLDPGLWTLAVDIDVTLLPGEYAVDVFLHHMEKGRLTIDWVERCLVFSARDVSESGDDHHERFAAKMVRGFVRPRSRWRSRERPPE